MKKRISVEELSAYIDGESKHPEKVRQQIQQSEKVARQHMALAKVAAQVRALPKSDVRPGFSGRVIASLDAAPTKNVVAWRMPVAASLAAVAALFAIVAVLGIQDEVAPTAVQTVASQSAPNAPSLGEEDALVAELERRLTASASTEMLQVDAFYETPAPVAALPEEMLLALAPSDWVGTLGGLDGTRDYELAVASLNESERDIFVQMLEDYAREETQDQSARNG